VDEVLPVPVVRGLLVAGLQKPGIRERPNIAPTGGIRSKLE